MIAKCALDFPAQGNEVTVESDDIDVLVLLIDHWKMNMGSICFKSEAKKMVWKIQNIVKITGELLTSHILFIHAWSDCDTTSATYGQGKTFLLKKFNKESEELQHISSIQQKRKNIINIFKFNKAKLVVVCLLFCVVIEEKSL